MLECKKKGCKWLLASILIFAHYINSRVFFGARNIEHHLLTVKPEYFVTGFDRFSKQCDIVQFVSIIFIPQALEQLLYQRMLVLRSVRNSASVLKQWKRKLRKVCHLMKDLCVQYVVPKWVLDVVSSMHCGSILKEELLLKSMKSLPFFFRLTSMMMPMEKSIVIGHLMQLLSESYCFLTLPISFLIHYFSSCTQSSSSYESGYALVKFL